MKRKLTAILYILTFLILCFNSPAAFCATVNEPGAQSVKKVEAEEAPSKKVVVEAEEPMPSKPQKHEKKYNFKLEEINNIEINCADINVDIVPSKDKENIVVTIKGKGINHPTALIEHKALKIRQKDKNTYDVKNSDDIIKTIKKAHKSLKDAGKYTITIHIAPEFSKNLSINTFRCNIKIDNLTCNTISVNAVTAEIKCDNLKTKSANFLSLSGKTLLKQFSGDLTYISPAIGNIDVKYSEFKNKIDLFMILGSVKIKFQKVKDFSLDYQSKWVRLKNDFENITSTNSKNKIKITNIFGTTKIEKL